MFFDDTPVAGAPQDDAAENTEINDKDEEDDGDEEVV